MPLIQSVPQWRDTNDNKQVNGVVYRVEISAPQAPTSIQIASVRFKQIWPVNFFGGARLYQFPVYEQSELFWHSI